MDFSAQYTEEQQRFRELVSAWLERELPDGPPSAREASELARRLGAAGWLAPSQPTHLGGGGLPPQLAAVLHQELETRGVGWLLKGPSADLRRALGEFGAEEQRTRLLPPLNRGGLTVWRTAVPPGAALDPGALGVRARSDGDDLVLDGADSFSGNGPTPDLLWVLALVESEAPPWESTVTLLVPAGVEGVALHTTRQLVEGHLHLATLRGVRVPRSALLGPEGEGWRSLQWSLLPRAGEEPPEPAMERHVAALWEYAAATTRGGAALSRDPALQQLLVEAYLLGRVKRLFRMRDTWLLSSGRALTYHADQTARLSRRAAARQAGIAREVAGIHCLLAAGERGSPAQGLLERQQRESLAESAEEGPLSPYSESIAEQLGLGTRTAPALPPSPLAHAEGLRYHPGGRGGADGGGADGRHHQS